MRRIRLERTVTNKRSRPLPLPFLPPCACPSACSRSFPPSSALPSSTGVGGRFRKSSFRSHHWPKSPSSFSSNSWVRILLSKIYFHYAKKRNVLKCTEKTVRTMRMKQTRTRKYSYDCMRVYSYTTTHYSVLYYPSLVLYRTTRTYSNTVCTEYTEYLR